MDWRTMCARYVKHSSPHASHCAPYQIASSCSHAQGQSNCLIADKNNRKCNHRHGQLINGNKCDPERWDCTHVSVSRRTTKSQQLRAVKRRWHDEGHTHTQVGDRPHIKHPTSKSGLKKRRGLPTENAQVHLMPHPVFHAQRVSTGNELPSSCADWPTCTTH
jgi:hypothetical protein